MEKHQEQLAKNADVNSAESLYRLSKEIFGSTRQKAAKNPLSFHVLQEVSNNSWENCAYCKEFAKSTSMWVFIFSTWYFHYMHQLLPPCSKISCDGLHLLQHVACCPPPSPSPKNHKPIFPILSPAFCLPDSSEQNGPHENQIRYCSCTQIHQAVGTVPAKPTETSFKSLYSAEGISREKTCFLTVCSNVNSCRSSCSITFIWHWRGTDTLIFRQTNNTHFPVCKVRLINVLIRTGHKVAKNS